MKTNIKIIFLSALFFISISTIAFPQESVILKYQMPAGKTYLYRTILASTITQDMMGKEMKINNDVRSITRVKIDSTDESGNLSLIVSTDSVIVHNKMRDKDTTINLNGLIGKRSRIDISEYGNILKQTIIDTISEQAQMMGSAITQLAANLYSKLPGKEIKKGENWNYSKIDSIKSMGGEIDVVSDYTYTLGDKENKNGIDCYQIPYTAAINSNGKADMSGMQFFIKGSGKMTGTIFISAADGALVGIEGNNENDMTLTTNDEQKMVIPVKQSSTVQTELIID